MKTTPLKAGVKHPLRLYQRPFEIFLWPSFVLAIVCAVVWWFWIDFPLPNIGRDFLLIIAPLAWLLFIVSLIAPSFCYVQCRPGYIVIRAVLFRLALSYSRVGNVVPINFATKYPLQRQSWFQRLLLEPLFYEQRGGQLTVVGVHILQYPIALSLLRLMFSKYMFFPSQDGRGFLFLVRNWLLLSHEIEDYREAWRARRTARKPKGTSVASRVLKKGERKR